MSIHIDRTRIRETDREMDRRNWKNNIVLCMHCMLTLDKMCDSMTHRCKVTVLWYNNILLYQSTVTLQL